MKYLKFFVFQSGRHNVIEFSSKHSAQVHKVFLTTSFFFPKVKVLCRSACLLKSDLNKLAGRERALEDSAANDGGGLWFCFERKHLDLTKGCQSHYGGSAGVSARGCEEAF